MSELETHKLYSIEHVRASLSTCMAKDRHGLLAKCRKIQTMQKQHKPTDQALQRLDQQFRVSSEAYKQRLERLPEIKLADDLPVTEHADKIRSAIRDNQVVVIAGETGSGKTTQIPKLCMLEGRGIAGLIGHTQPRRLAARSVASRIAEELNVKLGELVGYQVRFTDESNDQTAIKLMTDGILLNEIQFDPYLSKYDTLIIDEAHERSLNIDFLLGYIKRLLVKRKDMKVIITSATIDVTRFSKH
ncbi:MAG: ATP-dependent helicase HrpA, partial [Reinekea sp.]